MKKTKKIYCNGDSFTSGSELTDDLLSGFPGMIPHGHKTSGWDSNWNEIRLRKCLEKYVTYKNLVDAERLAAWPGYIQKFCPDIEITNHAFPGSSMEGIKLRTMLDLTASKRQGVIYDEVFIQVTNPPRISTINTSIPSFYYHINDYVLSAIDYYNDKSLSLEKKFIERYSDLDLSYKYLLDLNQLIETVNSIIGKRPILIVASSENVKEALTDIKSDKNFFEQDHIQALLENVGLNSIHPTNYMDRIHKKFKFSRMPLLHYEKRTHIEFAKVICERYF